MAFHRDGERMVSDVEYPAAQGTDLAALLVDRHPLAGSARLMLASGDVLGLAPEVSVRFVNQHGLLAP